MTTAVAKSLPWAPASEVASTLGFNAVLFGMPGCGKTTLTATAQDHPMGQDVLILAIDNGIRSLADRQNIMVWPKKLVKPTWKSMISFTEKLRVTDHPFKTVVLDDLTKGYRLCLDEVMAASPMPGTPSQAEWGKANTLLLEFIETWSDISRTTGLNFIVNAHAEEVKEESSGMIFIRVSATPGVVKGLPQIVDSMAYLSADAVKKERKLILHATPRISAKYRQPRTGPQLPGEILNPNMGVIFDHITQINEAQRIQVAGEL